jgi:glycosyltransferase involved in cell wall biosynthesis
MDPGNVADVQQDVQPGISAVLAARDEPSALEGDVLDLAAVLDGLVYDNFEIILVKAATACRLSETLAELRARHPDLPVRLLDGEHVGQAAAWAAGFEAAAYDLIFVTTADGQFEVRESNHLLEAIERGADLAIGYRAPRADGLVRRVEGWGWNVLVRLLFGRTARDVDCPVRLFRRSVWQRLDMRTCGPTPIFNAEFLVRARRLRLQVAEVPLSHKRPRSGSKRRAAGPAEIGRSVVELVGLRRSLDVHGANSDCAPPTRHAPSGRQTA